MKLQEIQMSKLDAEKPAPVIGGGIRVMMNDMLPPDEIILVAGKDAYLRIKNSGKLQEKPNE
tara:strand:- start:28666 stop:28851 length:186 start_codon:yes stop_codon:yes gene_type:complete